MAIIAAVFSGAINIGDETSPSYSKVITANGGTIVSDSRADVAIAISGTLTLTIATILPGLVTGLSFCHLKGTDSSGDPFPFSIQWDGSGAADIDTCTEFLWAIKVATAAVASVIITNLSASKVLTLEYILAGQ